MAVSRFGVVYGETSKIIRRIIVPTVDDAELDTVWSRLRAGENLLLLNSTDFPVKTVAALEAVVGTPTSSGRHARVNKATSLVDDIVIIDPLIDPPAADFLYVQHARALPGWRWNGSAFDPFIASVGMDKEKIASTGAVGETLMSVVVEMGDRGPFSGDVDVHGPGAGFINRNARALTRRNAGRIPPGLLRFGITATQASASNSPVTSTVDITVT